MQEPAPELPFLLQYGQFAERVLASALADLGRSAEEWPENKPGASFSNMVPACGKG